MLSTESGKTSGSSWATGKNGPISFIAKILSNYQRNYHQNSKNGLIKQARMVLIKFIQTVETLFFSSITSDCDQLCLFQQLLNNAFKQ